MSKFGWDLPPGCRVSDIPGNRPEDAALEAAEEGCMEALGKICHDSSDYEWVVALATALLPLVRHAYRAGLNEGNAEGYQTAIKERDR